jgi:hypothetical protein
MVVNVKQKNGIRYGSFDIHGVRGYFPRQIMTSTNLNHAKHAKNPNLDFRTQILEIVERYTNRLLTDVDYRQSRVNDIAQTIQENQDKLCLLVLNGAKSSLRATKEQNLTLIQFQIDCGFTLIKTFFKTIRNALQNSRDYRKIIPNGKSMVMILDENLDHDTFVELYKESYEKERDEIIGFLGREPNQNNDDNRLNLQFIANRNTDRILRLVSFIKKDVNGIANSLVYHWFGFDAYSFVTRFGPPNVPIKVMKALNGFVFEPLTRAGNFKCVITGMNLVDSTIRFGDDGRSSLPVSIHNIVRLNEAFETIETEYTHEEIQTLLGNRVF